MQAELTLKKKRTSRVINPRKRQKVFERDNFCCVHCGADGDNTCLEVDHIIPWTKGGESNLENLQTLCYKCNSKKFNHILEDDPSQIRNLRGLSPMGKLEMIKEKIEKYKHLPPDEFKLITSLDHDFISLGVSWMQLEQIYFKVSAFSKGAANGKGGSEYKLRVYLYGLTGMLVGEFGLTYQEISERASKITSSNLNRTFLRRNRDYINVLNPEPTSE